VQPLMLLQVYSNTLHKAPKYEDNRHSEQRYY
jgi:hypothetical protein